MVGERNFNKMKELQIFKMIAQDRIRTCALSDANTHVTNGLEV